MLLCLVFSFLKAEQRRQEEEARQREEAERLREQENSMSSTGDEKMDTSEQVTIFTHDWGFIIAMYINSFTNWAKVTHIENYNFQM